MKERVEMFNGHFAVESQLGKGTTVKFTIPTKKEEVME
jgi:signal transduction histidine kinase